MAGAAHTMLSTNPWPVRPRDCALGQAPLEPRTVRPNQVTHTLPVGVKIGTTFSEHSLAAFVKTKDVPTLSPSFYFEKSVLRNQAQTRTEAEAQTCFLQHASNRKDGH